MEGPDSHSYERIPFPTTEDLPSFREDKSVVPSSPDDTHFDASIYYNAFSKYLASYSVKDPENSTSRQKLTRLSRQQFQELCTDVQDELVRRSAHSDTTGAPFLPAQLEGDFHPKRNEARQKLATLATSRFPELVTDLHYELGCRYPECREG